MSAHNLCFEQKYENYQNFSSENFHFLVIKFSVYLNRHVLEMRGLSWSLLGPHHMDYSRQTTENTGFFYSQQIEG